MKFGSVCSGIEAASVAWPKWESAWFSEIEPFPCALLQYYYPTVPNLRDMTSSTFIERAREHGSIPDDYTLVDYRGKAAADGPRYKALGNSMAVPVMQWIGSRISSVLRDATEVGVF